MSRTQKEIDDLLNVAHKALPPKCPAGMKRMLDVLCKKISEDDLEFFDSNVLSDMAQSHWEMARIREQGKPKLRIYCPNIEDGICRKTVIDIVSDDMAFLVDSGLIS